MNQKVVIVGAGQAGIQVATSLRLGGFEDQIVLVGKEPWLPYQRPPLSKQVLKSQWAVEKCQLKQQDFFKTNHIDFRPNTTATGVRTDKQYVMLDGGEKLDYDHLVICTGSRLNRLSFPGPRRSGMHYLRTIDDAIQIRDSLSEGIDLAVIGAGYIGLEVAASARSLGCEVTVIEAANGIMQRSALLPVARFLMARHMEEGVRFHLDSRVEEVSGDSSVESVRLDNGQMIRADVVLKGIGVSPDIGWLEGSAIELGRGIKVDRHCRTSVENVLAAGDCAETQHPLYAGRVVLESVQNAVDQGKIAAAGILGNQMEYNSVPWFWSEQYDCRLQMAGLPQANDEIIVRDSKDGSLSVLSLGESRLNAIQCINQPADYMSGRKLIAFPDQIDASVLRDPSTDLKALLSGVSHR